MYKQIITSSQQQIPFQPLPQDSPELKPSSPLQQPQPDIINLELQDKEIEQLAESKQKRKRQLNAKKTNLIKIRPVKFSQQTNASDIQYLPQEESQQQTQKTFVNDFKIKNNSNGDKSKQQDQVYALQSPVVYRISDGQDQNQREQDIPKSSRRPLNQSKRDKGPKYSQQRIQSYDEPQSPIKLISKRRNSRSKQSLGNVANRQKNSRRFIKMRREVRKEERQTTEVIEYQEGEKSDSQKQEKLDEAESEQYESEEGEEGQEDDQYGHQRQIPLKNGKSINLKTPTKINTQSQITVFKSNSFYTLINAQLPKSNFINCIIKRKRTQDYFQTTVTYQIYLLQDKKYLMTCTKDRLFKTTSHFQFFRQKPNSISPSKDHLYAYMDSNFTGTEFVLKTIHKNDSNSQKSTVLDKSQLLRMQQSSSVISDQVHKGYGNSNELQKGVNTWQQRQMLYIGFKANMFGLGGQRQVRVLKKRNKKVKSCGGFSDIRLAQQRGEIDKYMQLNSKKAMRGIIGLEMDFKGIAKMQSNKNMILEDGDEGRQVLIFGKVKEDIYSVVIGWPLSIIEGVGVGIANLDRKFFVN